MYNFMIYLTKKEKKMRKIYLLSLVILIPFVLFSQQVPREKVIVEVSSGTW